MIADRGNYRIRQVNTNGIINTVAGMTDDNGPASSAQLNYPNGIAADSAGNLFITDTDSQRIRKISGVSSAPAPTPVPTPVVIVDCTDEVGSICTYAGTGATARNGDGHDRLLTDLYWPFDIEFTPSGRRIVLDWNNHLVREILSDDTFLTLVGTDFVGDGPKDLSDGGFAVRHETDGLVAK